MHGRLVGWGAGIKDKDVYVSPSEGSNLQQCVDWVVKAKYLKKKVKKLKRIVKLMLVKSSAQESSQKGIYC